MSEVNIKIIPNEDGSIHLSNDVKGCEDEVLMDNQAYLIMNMGGRVRLKVMSFIQNPIHQEITPKQH